MICLDTCFIMINEKDIYNNNIIYFYNVDMNAAPNRVWVGFLVKIRAFQVEGCVA